MMTTMMMMPGTKYVGTKWMKKTRGKERHLLIYVKRRKHLIVFSNNTFPSCVCICVGKKVKKEKERKMMIIHVYLCASMCVVQKKAYANRISIYYLM